MSSATRETLVKLCTPVFATSANGPTIGSSEIPDNPDKATLPRPPKISSCPKRSPALVPNSPVSKTARASPIPGVKVIASWSRIGSSSKTR